MGRHVHFIGIGGTGLSAIAMVLLERGDTVSGSDRQASIFTRRLEEQGARISIGHRAANIAGAEVVVRSSAVPDDNIEVQAGRAAGLPVLKRADFLSQLTTGQKTLAVAGTHGKTTTTALIAWILTALKQDPSYVIGGVSKDLGRNAHAGTGDYFVFEADEYDRMFLGLEPWIGVITNVEYDHPDCYPTPLEFYLAFQDFSDRVVEGGALLACLDDEGSALLRSRALEKGRRAFGYSLKDARADYYAGQARANALGGFSFDLYRGGERMVSGVELRIPGLHNVSNALAALGVADLLGLPLERVVKACQGYSGTGRRFELRGVVRDIHIIDDYAHHPTEIRATLAAARARFPSRRIWAIWQPHTYSRTRALLDEFATAFEVADQVAVTGIFAARELPPPDGFSGEQAANAIEAVRRDRPGSAHYFSELSAAGDYLLEALEPGDVVLVLSAGDADQISTRLVHTLGEEANDPAHGASESVDEEE